MTRRFLAAATTALAVAVTASPALAHEGNPDFRSELTGVTPEVPGLEAEVLNYDDSLQVRNETGQTVLILGYEGEPYVRIEGDGRVLVNTNSPAYYLNDDRYGESAVPPSADAEAEPSWEPVDGSGQYTWHDHRIHYMSRDVPSQVTDQSERTRIFDWEVPVEVGGDEVTLAGTLIWVGKDGGVSAALLVGLGAAVVASLALAVWRIRRRHGGHDSDEPAREAW
jgi:hypothetical protein